MQENVEMMYMITGHVPDKYPVDREALQDVFCDFLYSIGFDYYGHQTSRSLIKSVYTDDYCSINNDLFLIRPYYWGDDESIFTLPNFVYKPENIEIRWYKYPLRSGTSNVELHVDNLKRILNECSSYVHKQLAQKNGG